MVTSINAVTTGNDWNRWPNPKTDWCGEPRWCCMAGPMKRRELRWANGAGVFSTTDSMACMYDELFGAPRSITDEQVAEVV